MKALEVTRKETGIVIPVYLPDDIDATTGASLLAENVKLCTQQVEDSSWICLSVDGEPFGSDLASRLGEQLGVSTAISPENRGKLQAASVGVRWLLENKSPAYITVRSRLATPPTPREEQPRKSKHGPAYGREPFALIRAAQPPPGARRIVKRSPFFTIDSRRR